MAVASLAVLATLTATQQCREADDEPTALLNNGLTHMWTTPIMRHRLVKEEHANLLSAVEAAVMPAYEAFAADCTRKPLETSNDRWFDAQRQVFERGEPSFLEEPGSAAESAMKTLRKAWLDNMREYVANSIGVETADEIFEDSSALRLFVWASVHEGCSLHVPHVHQETAVSGVFYVSVPKGSGPISFDDPRGMRPPFANNRLWHTPVEGEMLLFPPWLLHSVAPSCDSAEPRVALSFNLMTGRAKDGVVDADWEVLADASVVMSGE